MDFSKTPFTAGVQLNGRYDILSPLNHGSFGVVVLAKDRRAGKLVAIKCMNKMAAQDGESFLQVDDRSEELDIHSRIGNHPNIVNYLDSFSTATHTFLVLEYCSMGDLYEAIRQDKGPKETEHVREFMLQLVNAVKHLHSKGIYHRDIKPENIFLTELGTMKLGDFGLATTEEWSTEAAVGSDRYMAPEQYDPAGTGLSPARADIWSIGICLLNILFSRNPFSVPSNSDPLFADFVLDRQSLFDVFPNMSQDTFEVLSHCLQIDPAKRSLSGVSTALHRAVHFTTDEEAFDDYCIENRDIVAATANREPLRTPSFNNPGFEQTESFPWTKALRMTSPRGRQLSIIHDADTVSEELFPDSDVSSRDWFSKADTQSIESTVDSGLGVSIDNDSPKSNGFRSRPVPIASSMPTFGRASSTLQSLFGKKKGGFESKSWSDLWEEEEEERAQLEHQQDTGKVSALSQVDSEEDGRSTPRALLPGPVQGRSSSNESHDESNKDAGISEHTGFVFEEHVSQASTPKPQSTGTRRILADKWAALGDMRRGGLSTSPARPAKSTSPAPDSTKSRFRPSNWRRASWKKGLSSRKELPEQDHSVWQQKDWNVSKDWRRSDQFMSASPVRLDESQLDGAVDIGDISSDDDEFVGGWKSLHL